MSSLISAPFCFFFFGARALKEAPTYPSKAGSFSLANRAPKLLVLEEKKLLNGRPDAAITAGRRLVPSFMEEDPMEDTPATLAVPLCNYLVSLGVHL